MTTSAVPDPTRADRIATHYRRMVGFFGLQLLVQLSGKVLAGGFGNNTSAGELTTLISMLLIIPAALAMLYQAIRLALTIGTLGAELCAVGLFAPVLARFVAEASQKLSSDPAMRTMAHVAASLASVVSLLCLLRLSAIATRECKAAGLSVGLLGPRRPTPRRAGADDIR